MTAATGGSGTAGGQRHAAPSGALDGVWRVERVSGLLPPLVGVRKEISGARGMTRVGPGPGVPFRVEGLELRYEPPLWGFVDVLEPDPEEGPEGRPQRYDGRATFRGFAFGRFRMRRAA